MQNVEVILPQLLSRKGRVHRGTSGIRLASIGSVPCLTWLSDRGIILDASKTPTFAVEQIKAGQRE